MNPKTQPPFMNQFKIISKLISFQLVIAAIIASLFFFTSGSLAAVSALIGSAIGVVPGIPFIFIYFRRTYARAARKVVNAFYLGEALKWFLTFALFTAAFQWGKLKPLPMFAAFIATQMAYWLVPLIYEQRLRIHSSSSRSPGDRDQGGDL